MSTARPELPYHRFSLAKSREGENIVTMCSHVHNTLVQRTRCTGRCTMQIRNPVVCHTGKSSLYK